MSETKWLDLPIGDDRDDDDDGVGDDRDDDDGDGDDAFYSERGE